MILGWLLYLPLLGAAAALALSRVPWLARLAALAACACDFGLALSLWRPAHYGAVPLDERAPWFPEVGVSYHLALDGLSLLLVLLTTLLAMVAVAASWREVTDRVGPYHFALLLTATGVIGVFLARDLFLFYFFWELMLIPMYFLIGVWGGAERVYATISFFLFTFISGLLMLAAIVGLAAFHLRATGVLTFDLAALRATPLSTPAAALLMTGFLAAFLTKLPAVPLHSWAPPAYAAAPTGALMLLSGALTKTAAYGLIRFAVPLFPQVAGYFALAAGILGVITIYYAGVIAFSQSGLKRLIAFTSVSHMGFILIGIYAGNQIGLQGALVQMLAHGISTPALFLLAGAIQQRCGTLDLSRLGGLWEVAPRLGGFTMVFAMAALGLPGLGNFVGEFLSLLGSYSVFPAIAILGAGGFTISVIYAVRLVQRTLHGPNREPWRIPDLSARELITLGALTAVIFWLGIWPQPVFASGRPALLLVTRALAALGVGSVPP